MGGQNHQPCSHYLERSTRLSRSLSLAFSELERANVVLEDIILAECAGGTGGSVDGVTNHLFKSKTELIEARSHLRDLVAQMKELSYQELPSFDRTDLSGLGSRLSASGFTNERAWDVVRRLAEHGGFYSVFDYFQRAIETLIERTEQLSHGISGLTPAAKRGQLRCVLEENQPGNIKGVFAVLYTSWSLFQQEFLASSLLSTELWYSFIGSGSLLDTSTAAVAA